jgi:hypothetical protein
VARSRCERALSIELQIPTHQRSIFPHHQHEMVGDLLATGRRHWKNLGVPAVQRAVELRQISAVCKPG